MPRLLAFHIATIFSGTRPHNCIDTHDLLILWFHFPHFHLRRLSKMPQELDEDIIPLDTTHFDAIVLGTGLCESMVAAGLARAGKSVLHLDHRRCVRPSCAPVALAENPLLCYTDITAGRTRQWT